MAVDGWTAPKTEPPTEGGAEWKTDPDLRTIDQGFPVYSVPTVGSIRLVCVAASKREAEEIAQLHNEKIR